jgi:uncharacterized membrane protein YeiB
VSVALEGTVRTDASRRPRRPIFIWADKIAFFLAFLWIALLAMFWLAANLICGAPGGNNLFRAIAGPALDAGAALIVSFWVVFRIADLAAGGRRRRS